MEIMLREYIDEKKISIRYIHKKTGIRYATVFDIVNGKNNKLNLKYLSKIMDAINISDVSLILRKKVDS